MESVIARSSVTHCLGRFRSVSGRRADAARRVGVARGRLAPRYHIAAAGVARGGETLVFNDGGRRAGPPGAPPVPYLTHTCPRASLASQQPRRRAVLLTEENRGEGGWSYVDRTLTRYLYCRPARPGSDASQPSFHRPPRPSFHRPPRPSFHRPPRPSFHRPPRPSFHRPPRPSFHRPPRAATYIHISTLTYPRSVIRV